MFFLFARRVELVVLSSRRKTRAVRSKGEHRSPKETGKQFWLKRKYESSLLRSLFVIFANQADPDGRPPGQGRNKRRKHSCASHSPEPAGTNSEAQESSAIFSFFLTSQIYYSLNSVPRRYVLRVGAFSADLSHGHAFDDAWSFRNCSFKASRCKKEQM